MACRGSSWLSCEASWGSGRWWCGGGGGGVGWALVVLCCIVWKDCTCMHA